MNHAGEMNRKQRRKQSRSKTITRRAGVTYLTVAGVIGGTLGVAGPAYTAVVTSSTADDCDDLEAQLHAMATNGGSVVADFEATCIFGNFDSGTFKLDFAKSVSITGPASGGLIIDFTEAAARGFRAKTPSDPDTENILTVSNLTFTQTADAINKIDSFIGSESGAELVINNTKFINTDLDYSAIRAQGGEVSVTNSVFEDLTSQDVGTAIDLNGASSLTVAGSTFKDIVSDGPGGAIFGDSQDSLSIDSSNFINVTSGGNSGGAIYVDGGDLLAVSDSSFTDVAGRSGGSIYVEGTDAVTITGTEFTNSRSTGSGGSLFVEGVSSFTVDDSTFTTNDSFLTSPNGSPEGMTADSNGGAIYSFSFTGLTLEVTNSNFSNLKSTSGGAIYTNVNSAYTISGSTFSNLDAVDGNGGAVYGVEGELTVSGSSFFENSSVSSGGAISAALESIDNSTFVDNSASEGAAFSSFSEGSIVSNSTFLDNGDSDSGSIASDFTYFFGNIMANESDEVKAIAEGYESNFDLGANLYTDDSVIFTDPISEGEGASKLVEFDDLKLSDLALNQTSPVNTGATKTAAIGADSVAKDYYSATSSGINPTGKDVGNGIEFDTRIASLDQRGVARQPSINRLDVGAYEAGEATDPEATDPEATDPEATDPEATASETLAVTGLDTETSYLGLLGLGFAAIFGGSIGLLRRRTKA